MSGKKAKRKADAAQVSKPVQKTPAKKTVSLPGYSNWLWIGGILLLTFIVFVPSLNNALTNWDDPRYLNDNPLIRELSAENIKRIFTEIYFGNYQPLHIFSYAIEYQLYGLDPTGYHTTSVIMHLIVTALVFYFILLLAENRTIAIISALLFGIHPLHVESVAWAAERKDLLYAIFFLASMIFYIKYLKQGEKLKFIVLAFAMFALSIFSKAMASSLPPVLVLIDIYYKRKFSLKLVLEKIPFFGLAIAMGLVSVLTVSSTGQTSLNVFNLFQRILIANFNLLAYVGKLILPVKLSAFYPYPANAILPWYFYAAPIVVAMLLGLTIWSVKRTRVVIFGTGFFVVCIFLVLQLFPVGPTIMSERYSYLPSIGFFFVAAYFIREAILKTPSLKMPLYGALAIYSLFLSVATYKRCDVWKDSMTLWTNVLDQFPHVGTALNNRGNIYGKEMGDLDRAMQDFSSSIRYEPLYENAYANRGIIYSMRGQYQLAFNDFNKALEINPKYFEALVNRGITYMQTGKYDSALTDLNKALEVEPGSFDALLNRAAVHIQSGDAQKALADLNLLEREHADNAKVYLFRGWAYTTLNKNDEALNDLNKAISIAPNMGDAYLRRSNVYYNKQQYREAFSDVQYAVSLGAQVNQPYFDALKKAAGG